MISIPHHLNKELKWSSSPVGARNTTRQDGQKKLNEAFKNMLARLRLQMGWGWKGTHSDRFIPFE